MFLTRDAPINDHLRHCLGCCKWHIIGKNYINVTIMSRADWNVRFCRDFAKIALLCTFQNLSKNVLYLLDYFIEQYRVIFVFINIVAKCSKILNKIVRIKQSTFGTYQSSHFFDTELHFLHLYTTVEVFHHRYYDLYVQHFIFRIMRI